MSSLTKRSYDNSKGFCLEHVFQKIKQKDKTWIWQAFNVILLTVALVIV